MATGRGRPAPRTNVDARDVGIKGTVRQTEMEDMVKGALLARGTKVKRDRIAPLPLSLSLPSRNKTEWDSVRMRGMCLTTHKSMKKADFLLK